MKKTKLEMIVRERCKKCGGIIGENIDGKPICQCEVWPGCMQLHYEYMYAVYHNPLITIPIIKDKKWPTNRKPGYGLQGDETEIDY